jgi:hypothetical protein
VKIRNPWAQTEWTGEWSDHCPNWEEVSDEEKERIGFAVEDDGGFYMNFEDWIGEFEMFTICEYWFSVKEIIRIMNFRHASATGPRR